MKHTHKLNELTHQKYHKVSMSLQGLVYVQINHDVIAMNMNHKFTGKFSVLASITTRYDDQS